MIEQAVAWPSVKCEYRRQFPVVTLRESCRVLAKAAGSATLALIGRTASWQVHGHNDKSALYLREGVCSIFRDQDAIAFDDSPRCSAFELGSCSVFVIRAPFVLQFATDSEDSGSINDVNDLYLHIPNVGVGIVPCA